MKVEFFSSSGGGGGGTDTNLGNSNLIADNSARTYKVASSGTLKFTSNGGASILGVQDSGASVVIGDGGTNYTMPNARGTADEILHTNGSGVADWSTLTNSIGIEPQSMAINNYLASASVVANEVYVSEETRKGSFLSIGANSITTINTTQAQNITKTNPFRQISDDNILLKGNMNVKFTTSVDGTYDLVIIAVSMTDTQAIATCPITFTTLTSIAIGRTEINQWFCFELSTDSITSSPCTTYYLGVVPRASGTTTWNVIAHYTQSNRVDAVFS